MSKKQQIRVLTDALRMSNERADRWRDQAVSLGVEVDRLRERTKAAQRTLRGEPSDLESAAKMVMDALGIHVKGADLNPNICATPAPDRESL